MGYDHEHCEQQCTNPDSDPHSTPPPFRTPAKELPKNVSASAPGEEPLKHATFMNTSIRCRRAEVQALLPACGNGVPTVSPGQTDDCHGRDDTHQSAGTHVRGSRAALSSRSRSRSWAVAALR